jgi:hypothetical protein
MTFLPGGLITEPLEAGDANFKALRPMGKVIGIIHAMVHLEKGFEL